MLRQTEHSSKNAVSDELWRLEKAARVLAIRLKLIRKHCIDIHESVDVSRLYRDLTPATEIAKDIHDSLAKGMQEIEDIWYGDEGNVR